MKKKNKGWTHEEILQRLKRSKPLVLTPNELKRPNGKDAKPDKASFVPRRRNWEQDLSHVDFDHECEKAGGGIAQHSVTAGQQEGIIAKWYETEGGYVRLAYEIELLKEQFPKMQVGQTKDGQVVVCGSLGPNNLLSKVYYVEARFPDDFGSGSAISVYVPKEDFPPGTSHLSPGGELSLAHWEWTCRNTACDALEWATHWLAQYERFQPTGNNDPWG
jgi:hypothetical protein